MSTGCRTSPRCSLAATINEAQFYGFDMLAGEGDDYRRLPLSMRKTNLARLLARRVDGIHLAPFERSRSIPLRLSDGPRRLGLPRDSAYRAGLFDRWVKNKNRQHPAFSRVRDQFS